MQGSLAVESQDGVGTRFTITLPAASAPRSDASTFISAIAPIANAQDHHPDLLLHDYKMVRVMLSTHSAKGITQKDFTLARAIDGLQSAQVK